jgi:hypothetical protein
VGAAARRAVERGLADLSGQGEPEAAEDIQVSGPG